MKLVPDLGGGTQLTGFFEVRRLLPQACHAVTGSLRISGDHPVRRSHTVIVPSGR